MFFRCFRALFSALASRPTAVGPLLGLLAAQLSCFAELPALKRVPTPNRLAQEKSPYLLQHQHNPVDWYPWGEEAFIKARNENKPIFLSVGYSTCHWCHVMAHESFEDPKIAALLNESFVSVKVDREERPDVDRVYMSFIQATTGGGGWPMSVFLTPSLEPFLGGTYYPTQDRQGRPSFGTILKRISEAWKTDQKSIRDHGADILGKLKSRESSAPPQGPVDLSDSTAQALNHLTESFDEAHGGFSRAPKFPRPVTLTFLLEMANQSGVAERDRKVALGMALVSLQKMAAGGMHDHLGGGFHRYSVDRFWHVPHFEKMLYDQALLTLAYIDAFQLTGNRVWADVSRSTLDYVLRDLTSAEGGFYSAEDADSLVSQGSLDHAEGAFYVWTKAEILEALGEEKAAVFNAFYGVTADGNAPEGSDPHGELRGKNILIQRFSVSEAAKQFGKTEEFLQQQLTLSRKKLFEKRASRPRPHLDDKIITAWNGLMISAFARGAQTLNSEAYLSAARAAAHFIEKHLWRNGLLFRSFRGAPSDVLGFADDHAFLIQGLLDLYEADFNVHWLQWALVLQKSQDTLFSDEKRGGYFSTVVSAPNILVRMKEDSDGAEPSPNSVSALNLLRLSRITADSALRNHANRIGEAFAESLSHAPTSLPLMLCALQKAAAEPTQIIIAGSFADPQTRALLQAVHRKYLPNKLLLLADGSSSQDWLAQRLPFLRDVKPISGTPTAYVCENFVCREPVLTPEKLQIALGR
jgi:uncharacterized protein YyaL (SSP411 family)